MILASAVSLYPSADSAGNKSSFSIVLGSGSSVCISIETVLAGLVFSWVVCVSCSVIFIRFCVRCLVGQPGFEPRLHIFYALLSTKVRND